MSVILRWFHDGNVRYHAYYSSLAPSPRGRQLIIASRDGAAIDIMTEPDRRLEDFSDAELISYARQMNVSNRVVMDAAAD
jgi:hypothetical protein